MGYQIMPTSLQFFPVWLAARKANYMLLLRRVIGVDLSGRTATSCIQSRLSACGRARLRAFVVVLAVLPIVPVPIEVGERLRVVLDILVQIERLRIRQIRIRHRLRYRRPVRRQEASEAR